MHYLWLLTLQQSVYFLHLSKSLPYISIDSLGCCPTGDTCCTTGCCDAGQSCCGISYCADPGEVCCSFGTCPAGWKCCSLNGCAPSTGECCSDGGYCTAGNHCYLVYGVVRCCTDSHCTAHVSAGTTLFYTTSTTAATTTKTPTTTTTTSTVSLSDVSWPRGLIP
jgi:hypothetical protein